MKRPIAELLTMAVHADAEAERAQEEHEAWQILRRKQGYITHRIYRRCAEPLQRLVYSEWESRKAVDGARQHLRGTPLMRRASATLATAPQRLVVELIGPITSTKGLALPDGAVAACMTARVALTTANWRELMERYVKALAEQEGYITHVAFRGFDDPQLAGWLWHWTGAEAFTTAQAGVDRTVDLTAAVSGTPQCVLYSALRD